MLEASALEASLHQLSPNQLRAALANFLPKEASTAERIAAVEAGLRSPLGQSLRDAMARWIVDEIVPVERLVPEAYLKWRPPVRDSMMFVQHVAYGSTRLWLKYEQTLLDRWLTVRAATTAVAT